MSTRKENFIGIVLPVVLALCVYFMLYTLVVSYERKNDLLSSRADSVYSVVEQLNAENNSLRIENNELRNEIAKINNVNALYENAQRDNETVNRVANYHVFTSDARKAIGAAVTIVVNISFVAFGFAMITRIRGEINILERSLSRKMDDVVSFVVRKTRA